MGWWWSADRVRANVPWGLVHWKPFQYAPDPLLTIHPWARDAMVFLVFIAGSFWAISFGIAWWLGGTATAITADVCSGAGLMIGIFAVTYADYASANAYDVERIIEGSQPRSLP